MIYGFEVVELSEANIHELRNKLKGKRLKKKSNNRQARKEDAMHTKKKHFVLFA